jgi:hypothetical protein
LNYCSDFFLVFPTIFPIQLGRFIVSWTIWIGVVK